MARAKVDSHGMTKNDRIKFQRKVLEAIYRRDRLEYVRKYFPQRQGENRLVVYPNTEVYSYYSRLQKFDYFPEDWGYWFLDEGEYIVFVTWADAYCDCIQFYNPSMVDSCKEDYDTPFGLKLGCYKQIYEINLGCKKALGNWYRTEEGLDEAIENGDIRIRLVKKGKYVIELGNFYEIKKALGLDVKVNRFMLYDLCCSSVDRIGKLIFCHLKSEKSGKFWSKKMMYHCSLEYEKNKNLQEERFEKLAKIRIVNQ